MPNRKADVTQTELKRYAKAMRGAGIDEFRVEIDKPDGTRVSIVAGKSTETAEADEFDKLIEKVPTP